MRIIKNNAPQDFTRLGHNLRYSITSKTPSTVSQTLGFITIPPKQLNRYY